MRSARARLARRLLSLTAIAAVVTAVGGCESRRELQPGNYRAVLELPGGELPFGLDIAREEDGFVLYLLNGEERVRVDEVTAADGRLTATMPGYENTLTAEIRGRKLRGEVSLLRAGGERQVLPFRAEAGQTWRVFEEPSTDNADVGGRWSVTFTSDEGKQSPGVAEFTQSFERVTGTILTPTGDHRYLAGDARDDELRLSRFDGAQAHLYVGRLNERGELVGEHWSGQFWHERFVAVRNPDAELDTSAVATGLRDPDVKLEFTFPDLDGKPVSLSDPRFQGKVVIVALAGSWCPNCQDEADFLVDLYREHHARGLEIVSLMFEHFGDFAKAAGATRRFRRENGVEYATLIAGTSDRDEAAKALPQLTGIFAFPTTIFVDRSGRVRRIHAGFSGPATGLHYEQLKQDFTSTVEALLAEPAGGPAADGALTGERPDESQSSNTLN